MKLNISDIARVAYEAARTVEQHVVGGKSGGAGVSWDEAEAETREAHIARVRTFIDNPTVALPPVRYAVDNDGVAEERISYVVLYDHIILAVARALR